MEAFSKFSTWLTGELIGLWVIWSTYMALKFLIELGQGQPAAFSVHTAAGHNPGAVGALLVIPLFFSILGSIIWTVWAANEL